MKLSGDLPKTWIIVKALLFVVIAVLSLLLILLVDDWRQELLLALILMWASSRLYYFCFYVISQYLDPSYQFTGLVSSVAWMWSRMGPRGTENGASSPQDKKGVAIRITALVDESQPGWVAFELIDAEGARHLFVDKAPIVSAETLDCDSRYPRDGLMACEVLSSWTDEGGRSLSKIDTTKPWGIESKDGQTEFVVLSETVQLLV